MPIRPSAASFESSSRGNCCASSHSRDVRAHLALRKLADAAPQQFLIGRESEVHRRGPIVSFGMRLSRLLPLMCILLAASSRPALADATLFIGTTTTPSNRTTKGFAIGVGLLDRRLRVRVRVNDGRPLEGRAAAADRHGQRATCRRRSRLPGCSSTRRPAAGVYRETLGTTHQETHVGFNTGGGVKVSLLGPLKARLDYRVFKLRGDAALLDGAPCLRGR